MLPDDQQPFWGPDSQAEMSSSVGIDIAINLGVLLICALLAWGGH